MGPYDGSKANGLSAARSAAPTRLDDGNLMMDVQAQQAKSVCPLGTCTRRSLEGSSPPRPVQVEAIGGQVKALKTKVASCMSTADRKLLPPVCERPATSGRRVSPAAKRASKPFYHYELWVKDMTASLHEQAIAADARKAKGDGKKVRWCAMTAPLMSLGAGYALGRVAPSAAERPRSYRVKIWMQTLRQQGDYARRRFHPVRRVGMTYGAPRVWLRLVPPQNLGNG